MVYIPNLGTILIVIVSVVSLVLIYLIMIEKRLHKKASKIKNTKNRFYIEKISKLTLSNPQTTLKEIDKIARNFFREAFKIKPSMEYGELKEIFTKKHNKKMIEFCEKMSGLLYAGRKPEKKQNQKLISILVDIIAKNQILTKPEKEILDKKSQAKDKKAPTSLRKLKILEMIKRKFKRD